jgi:hypothetical protein
VVPQPASAQPTWVDDARTADGAARLRAGLSQLSNPYDILRLRRIAKAELEAATADKDRQEAATALKQLLDDIETREKEDVRTPAGIARLRKELAQLSTLDDIAVIGDYAEVELTLIDLNARTGRDLEAVTKGWRALMASVDEKETGFDPPMPRSWPELRTYAEKLRPRQAFRQPRTMTEHLNQRLGDTQRGNRPSVRVRRIVDGNITYVNVDAGNYATVLEAAAKRPWTELSQTDRMRLEGLANDWQPFPVDADVVEKRTDEWLKKLTVYVDEFTGYAVPTAETFRMQVGTAVTAISQWIEPGVLDLIGLPDIVVHRIANPHARYDEKEQKIHITRDTFFPSQIQHEFGHHVEEQGPVEVWCGLATFLRASSNGAPLDPPRDGVTRKPTYGRDPDSSTLGVSGLYALTYYEDAGTELVALALEHEIANSPNENVDWSGGYGRYDPRYMATLLQALRPNAYRQAGLSLPALLA